MLWYTRYYLAGFTWEPDSARNLAVSLKIPEILNGLVFPGSGYGSEFPIAHILEYAIAKISGAGYVTYLHLVPLINIIIFTLLVYTFTSKLFSHRTAFLTTFISMIGMHYIIFIMGEHTTGLLLMLTILILALNNGMIWRILTFLMIPVIIICHPISPILLAVFLTAIMAGYLSLRNIRSQSVTAAILVTCITGWISWPLIYSQLVVINQGVSPVGGNLLSQIIPEDLNTAQQYTLGNAFIYSDIFNLNKAIYLIYGLLAITTTGIILIRTYRKRRDWRDYLINRGGLSRQQIVLIICMPLFLLATVLMSEHAHDLLERALTPAILVMSGIIASITISLYNEVKALIKKLIAYMAVFILLFLTLSFPVVTYSIDAYSSFPLSEKSGLEFVANNVPLKEKILVDTFKQQMPLFQSDITGGTILSLKPSLDRGDVFILRSTGYYYAAMRFEFSFTDNKVTRYREYLNMSPEVKSIYYNPSTSVFIKNN
jgi:hypothetical protein